MSRREARHTVVSRAVHPFIVRERYGAFTIIELLAATAIAALLMGGVMMIVAQLSGDQRRLAKQETSVDIEPLIQLLRRDLVRARTIVPDPNGRGFVLEGFGALDASTLASTGRAARVEYLLRQTEAGFWLVRQQTSLDSSSSEPVPGGHPWIEYICPGVKEVSLMPEVGAMDDSGRPSGKAKALQTASSVDDTSVANRFHLRIQWTETARAPLLRELVLR